MSVHYSVQFYEVLTPADGTGWIMETVVTIAKDPAAPTFSFGNDNDYLGHALMVRTHGTPMVARVHITVEHGSNEISSLERLYFIGDPGMAVAVRFGGPMGDCKPYALHSYDDDVKLYDLGRTSAR